MHVAFCGPVSLRLLKDMLDSAAGLPEGYECPLMSYVIRALLDTGVRVTVVTSCGDIERTRTWSGSNLRVIATPRRKHYLYCLDAYRQEIWLMCQAIVAARPDIVHANWAYEFADAALRSKLPCLVTSHDSPWTISKLTRHWFRLYRALYASLFVIPRIQNHTFVSPYLKNEFAYHHKVMGRYWIVPNGIAEDLVARNPCLCLKNVFSPAYISISAWDSRKNPQTLIKAFARVRSRLPQAKLSIFGSGFQADGPAQKWAEKTGFSQGILFGGCVPHDEVLSQLARADVCVHTTLEESFCMAVLEAMALGLPCIGGKDSGAVPWLLDEGRAGVVVDVRSPEAVAEAMVQIAEDSELFARMAAQGHARVKACFTLDAVAKQYVAVYEEILRDAPSHGVS